VVDAVAQGLQGLAPRQVEVSPELLAAVLLSVGSMTCGVSMLQAPSSRVDASAG
jgi:hypothetical protein